MTDSGTEKKKPDLTIFWKIVFPVLTIVLLLFVLFITFSLPDWALSESCGKPELRIQRALSN